ncbi:MAG: hypothetical protein IBJ11_12300 [Phycisphaerales bacterium]|nr:hypothetical protein [Phycisphaerales bacterium]
MLSLANARSTMTLAMTHRDRAAALATFDPKPDLERIAGEGEALAKELTEQQRALLQNKGALDVARAEAAKLEGSAKSARAEEGDARQKAIDLTGEPRLEAIKQANAAQRRADGFDVKRSEMELAIGTLERARQEIEARIAGIGERARLLNESKTRVEATAKLLREQTQEARRASDEAAKRFSELVAESRSVLTGELLPAHDAAVAKFGAAAGSASQARSGGGDSGQAALVAGEAQHASAGLQRGLGQVLGHYATLAGAAVKAKLGDAAALESLAKEAGSSSQERLKAAGEAFDQASSSLSGGGGRGGAAELLTKLSEELGKAAKQLRGEPATPPAAPDTPASPAGEPAHPEAPDAPAAPAAPAGTGEPAMDAPANPGAGGEPVPPKA